MERLQRMKSSFVKGRFMRAGLIVGQNAYFSHKNSETEVGGVQ